MMASEPGDSEGIQFMDDVDDEVGLCDKESHEQPKRARRRKIQVLSEHLKVDPNDNMVKELRQDRIEHLKSEKASKDSSNGKSVVDDHAVQELLEDRRKAVMERDRKRKSKDLARTQNDNNHEQIEMSQHDDQERLLDEEGGNDNSLEEDKEILDHEHENADEIEENKDGDDEKDTSAAAADDDDDADGEESEEESYCTMKSDLFSAESSNNLQSCATNFYDCRSSPSEISMLPSQDTPLEEIRENITEDTGAKPKKIVTKHTDIDNCVPEDGAGSPGALKNNKDAENIGLQNDQKAATDKEKIREHKKKMTLNTKCLHQNGKLDRHDGERETNNNNKEIIITLTTAEGFDKDPALNDTLDQSFDEDAADTNKKGSPVDTSNSEAPLNIIRKVSDESSNTTSSLLAQKELYQKSKAKPFKDLQRLKVGLIGVGIEGDQKRSYIKAITIMTDQKLVMFDRNNKCLKLFDRDLNPLDRVHIGVKFCSLASMADGMVAATMPDQKMLQLYHIHNVTKKIQRERTHDIEAEFYSVSHYKNRLFLMQRLRNPDFTEADEWHVVRLDLNKQKGRLKQMRTICPGHQDNSVLATEFGVYVTNKLEGEVLLLKHDGTFKYRHKVELSLPMGLTADKFGNVYICGGSVTSFIEVCKPDIKRYRAILNKTSIDPVAMCYDKRDNFLYVCDKIQGKIIKYKIEHSGFVHSLMKSFVMPGRSQADEE